MRRREVLAAVLSAPAVAAAQTTSPTRVYRLGALVFTSTSFDLIRTTVVPALGRLGYVEGQNLALDVRLGAPDAMPALAQSLAQSQPDAILAIGNVAAAAARDATATTPIVFFGSDPVELGWATSFAQPASNITGLTILAPELDAKRLELLKAVLPDARRFAALVQPLSPNAEARRHALGTAAIALHVELELIDTAGPRDYLPAFRKARDSGAQGVVVGSDPIFLRDVEVIEGLAQDIRLATICHWREMAARGCLSSYGPRLPDMYQRAAELVARIFHGERPGDLPIEQPTRFEFVLNLKTAKAIGIEVPPTLLARADEVIE